MRTIAFDNPEDLLPYFGLAKADEGADLAPALVRSAFSIFRSFGFKAVELMEWTETSSLQYVGACASERNPEVVRLGTRARDLTVLFSLLHEAGHALQGPPPVAYDTLPNKEKLPRETAAWDTAKKLLDDNGAYDRLVARFTAHSTRCLETYGASAPR